MAMLKLSSKKLFVINVFNCFLTAESFSLIVKSGNILRFQEVLPVRASNYTPINILHARCKVFEYVIHKLIGIMPSSLNQVLDHLIVHVQRYWY